MEEFIIFVWWVHFIGVSATVWGILDTLTRNKHEGMLDDILEDNTLRFPFKIILTVIVYVLKIYYNVGKYFVIILRYILMKDTK